MDEAARQAIYDRLVADSQRLSELIEVTTTADELSRLLVVEDDGPGGARHVKSAIFDRLTHGETGHTHPKPGLGLGLYLVDQIARAHDGRAWVEDRDEGGASFRVLLPVARPGRQQVTGP